MINEGDKLMEVYGVFLKSPDGNINNDFLIYMAFSLEAAERKRNAHAFLNGNFRSNYVIRRVDQQELDTDGRLIYMGDENDEAL